VRHRPTVRRAATASSDLWPSDSISLRRRRHESDRRVPTPGWPSRLWRCPEPACPTGTWSEDSDAIASRAVLTGNEHCPTPEPPRPRSTRQTQDQRR
jgi:hypothetical protein